MVELTKETEKLQPWKQKKNGKPGKSFKEGVSSSVRYKIKSHKNWKAFVRFIDMVTLLTLEKPAKHGKVELRCIG